ncbi:MAG: hypothetical protein JW947_00780 [Sedimentisphaerales bacterium]|nr:hypothetical protein [Sedimentisphaerales bacterium]
MKNTKICIILLILLAVTFRLSSTGFADQLGQEFTYQGRLIDSDQPADGLYDFQFRLFDANTAGNQIGDDANKPDVDVIDGYFTTELNFGSVFDGNERWLDIGVRPGEQSDPCEYTFLRPRQKITPTPYALYALNGGGSPWQVNSSLDMNENNIDDLGDLIHDEATASDFNITNEDQDKDIIFYINDGGIFKDVLTLKGATNSIQQDGCTASGAKSVALGTSTASGDNSVAMGLNTTASGNYSTAIGYYSTAIGAYSIAIGSNATASGAYSTAIGLDSTASNTASVAIGEGAVASGDASTAMGLYTTASEYYSTSMGFYTLSSGRASTAMGVFTKAESYASTAAGRYNIGGGTADSWVATDPLYEIGIGTADDNRANALTVLKNGNVGIGTTSPDRTLHVKDVMRLEPRATAPSSPSEGDMYMDSTTHKLMVYDGTAWQACW